MTPHLDQLHVEHCRLPERPQPLPEPSFQARAFMPEDPPFPGSIEPDETLQAWSNRLHARHGGAA